MIVIDRAMEYLNLPGVFEDRYDLKWNKCETVATYFKTGAGFSVQSGGFHVLAGT